MFISCVLLAICVSIDSLGIGLTYGLKNTKISFVASFVLFIICLIITSVSVSLGNCISQILSPNSSKVIGAMFLCILGIWIVIQSITSIDNMKTNIVERKNKKNSNLKVRRRQYQFFIDFLGIEIQIIKDPTYSDLDNSNKIDGKEALYLGIALSLDSIGIGIGSSVMGLNTFLFPLLSSIFLLVFLAFGIKVGQKIRFKSKIPQNIWSIVSGILLIIIGFCKIVL